MIHNYSIFLIHYTRQTIMLKKRMKMYENEDWKTSLLGELEEVNTIGEVTGEEAG